MGKHIDNPNQLNLFSTELKPISEDDINLQTDVERVEQCSVNHVKQDARIISIASVNRAEIYAEILKRTMS